MDLLLNWTIECIDSDGEFQYYNTEAVDDDHAQRRFFHDRETQPQKFGDWQPFVTTLTQV